MKDGLGEEATGRLAEALSHAVPGFSRARFLREARNGLEVLELKQRVDHLIGVMHRHLPDHFVDAVPLLRRAGEAFPPGDPGHPLNGFAAWPLIDYSATHGIDHPDHALPLLADLTHLFSAEFAIRPFIGRYWNQVEVHFQKWVHNPQPAIRRLVSEGSRPRLPWGMRLSAFVNNPAPMFPFLEILKNDPNLVVRRSVANHLNDISKDHPDRVVKLAWSWLPEATEETRWILRHACRSLIKSGHPEVFTLLGFAEKPQFEVVDFRLTPKSMPLGGTLRFVTQLKSTARIPQRLAVDFAIHHVKANGETRPKVFKLREVTLEPGAVLKLEHRHPIRPITTRKYHAGRHAVELLINGRISATAAFDLRV